MKCSVLAFFVFVTCFCLNYVAEAQHNPNNWPDRQVMVHLFEWKWEDVAAECERFLAPKGFAGVQVILN